MQYQGHYYEWIPLYNDPAAPCALKCHARGQSLVVELAPKVLDGTRCNADSLDMCISGICQVSHTCHTRPGLGDGPCPFSVMRLGSFRCKCIPWERMHRAGFREMTDFSPLFFRSLRRVFKILDIWHSDHVFLIECSMAFCLCRIKMYDSLNSLGSGNLQLGHTNSPFPRCLPTKEFEIV